MSCGAMARPCAMALAMQIGLQRIDVARQVIRLAVVVIAVEARVTRLMVLRRALSLSLLPWTLSLPRSTTAATAPTTAAVAAVARLTLWALTVLIAPWWRAVVERSIRTCLCTVLTTIGIGATF